MHLVAVIFRNVVDHRRIVHLLVALTGKSTCIQLLLRYYDATDGFVSIDQKDVTSVTLNNLRSQLGTVSQEPSLFDRTIAENVAYGDNSREISREEVIEVAKQANIHNFVVSLPLVSCWE